MDHGIHSGLAWVCWACRRVKEIPVFAAQCQSVLRSDSEDALHSFRMRSPRLLLRSENLIE
jgi:hypothetical protein